MLERVASASARHAPARALGIIKASPARLNSRQAMSHGGMRRGTTFDGFSRVSSLRCRSRLLLQDTRRARRANRRSRSSTSWSRIPSHRSAMTAAATVSRSRRRTDTWRCTLPTTTVRMSSATISRSPLSGGCSRITPAFATLRQLLRRHQAPGPEQLEAIDMGRRGIHNEAAELLRERLSTKVASTRKRRVGCSR